MFKKILGTTCAMICASTISLNHNSHHSESPKIQRNAISIIYPENSTARGIVAFNQASFNQPLIIAVTAKGLNPNGKHGIHIHQFGDLSEGCATAGAHFNPQQMKHGGPHDQERHAGDLGNLISDPFGNAYMTFKTESMTLFGQNSILGRSVVIHQNEDDLGKKGDEDSLKTGNSGPRIACGIIGLSKEFKTIPPSDV